MKTQKEFIKGDARHKADHYYSVRGPRAVRWAVGWGDTPRKAWLNWLYQAGRRRFPVE